MQVDRHHHRIHPVAWLAGDDDRNASTVHHGSADRTEQHSGESATAVATDDDQLGRLGLVEKTAGRLIPNHHPFDADVGVAVLPAGDALRQGLLGGGLLSRPFQARPSDTSASLQVCRATKSTPRQEASSNAIAVANSDAGEPSIPTNTGCIDDGTLS